MVNYAHADACYSTGRCSWCGRPFPESYGKFSESSRILSHLGEYRQRYYGATHYATSPHSIPRSRRTRKHRVVRTCYKLSPSSSVSPSSISALSVIIISSLGYPRSRFLRTTTNHKADHTPAVIGGSPTPHRIGYRNISTNGYYRSRTNNSSYSFC